MRQIFIILFTFTVPCAFCQDSCEYAVYKSFLSNPNIKDMFIYRHEQNLDSCQNIFFIRENIQFEKYNRDSWIFFGQDSILYKETNFKLDTIVIFDYITRNRLGGIFIEDAFRPLPVRIFANEDWERYFEKKNINPKEWNYDHNGFINFFKVNPNSYGIIFLSRVGFNKTSTIAFFSFSFLIDMEGGHGYYIIMKKVNGNWLMADWIFLWMA